MFIGRANTVTDELVAAFEHLFPQLKFSFPAASRADMEALIASDSSILLYARYPDGQAAIAGILTLIIYRVPTGIRARVEDLVVDEAMRGKGVGQALVRYAMDLAREAGADGVALTSNPKREAANRLYQKLGFKPWQTNLYFYKF
ncbi:MAG: GNAT family N-acetyltransferase [Anaerolineales bacterium]